MKSVIIFTGTGPILILTTYSALTDPGFIEKLAVKGIKKFIATGAISKLKNKIVVKNFPFIKMFVRQLKTIRYTKCVRGGPIYLHFVAYIRPAYWGFISWLYIWDN